MSVVGFDIGNVNTVIAVARNKGIDVICNEVSNRATPSLVSFGPKRRYIGEQAKTQELSNFKNTVGALKRLLGPVSQSQFDVEVPFSGAELSLGGDGTVSAAVEYLGERRVFTYVQLMAMFLSKLKETTELELKSAVTDVVIGVPIWFTDAQRRALNTAAHIAGLNVLRVINDISAAGLQWGITRDLSEQPKHIAIVDMGDSDFTVQISEFSKGKMAVKSCAYDRALGGRSFDDLLLRHFIEEIKTKYKMDVSQNTKAMLRLRTQCERVKKILSANLQAPLNLECLMNDKDVASLVNRGDFEEMIKPLLDRILPILQSACDQAGIKASDVEAIEIVGGTTRIPAVKNIITSFFGKEPSTTLNQDECVAKGCAFMCAILSPVFRTREFKVEDICVNPIKLVYPSSKDGDEMKELLAFPVSSVVPSTKLLTFSRNEPFDIEAFQAERWIGKYSIKVPRDLVADGAESTIKVKIRLNPDSLLEIGGAHVLVDAPEKSPEEKEKDKATPSPAPAAEADKKEKESEANGDQMDVDKAPSKKVKKDIAVSGASTSPISSIVETLRSNELEMITSDKLVIDTDVAKNSLEEYIYDLRGKLESTHAEFSDEKSKAKMIKACEETEDWLYGEGEEATKSVYVDRLAALKKDGQPVYDRFYEFETLPSVTSAFYSSVAKSLEAVRASHMTEEEKSDMAGKLEAKRADIDKMISTDSSKPKYENRTVTCSSVRLVQNELENLVRVAISKAKPPPPPAATKKEDVPMTSTEPSPEANKEEMIVDGDQQQQGEVPDVDMAER